MTFPEVLEAMREHFPDAAVGSPDPAICAVIPAQKLRSALELLRNRLGFDYLVFVAGTDWPERSEIELTYRFFSYETRVSALLRIMLPREGASVSSVADLYRTAEWHERETSEMLGVEFVGNPDPRRLLLADDIEGYPLRKDFTHPNMIRLPEVE